MANRMSAFQFFTPKENTGKKNKSGLQSASPAAKRRKVPTESASKEPSTPNASLPSLASGVRKQSPQITTPVSTSTQSKKKRKRNKKAKQQKPELLSASAEPNKLLQQLIEKRDISEAEDDPTWNESAMEKYVTPSEEGDVGQLADLDEVSSQSDEDEFNSDIPIQPMEAAKILGVQIMGKDLTGFFKDVFGQKSIILRGSLERPLHLWYQSNDIFETLRNERFIIGEDLHLTKYENGEKVSLEEGSVAYPCLLRDMIQEEGCTIRLVQPHRYHRSLASRLSLLQEIFGSAMGCNVYYTPEQAQGFAPHYDDIDAFILQLEGSKHWRVYKPRMPSEAFDLKSSGDFTMEDIANCECVLDTTLHPGDVLYMPRSYIHHAFSNGDEPSLHLTISTYQNTSYLNLLEKLMPLALPRFMASHVQVRKNLPLGYLSYMGTLSHPLSLNPQLPHSINRSSSAESQVSSSRREKGSENAKSGGESSVSTNAQRQRAALEAKVREYLHKLADWKHLPIDEACDLLGLDMVRFSIPPTLLPGEARNHVSEASFEPTLKSLVRLTRWSTLRLVTNKQVGIVVSPEDQAELEREDAVESIAASATEKPSSGKNSNGSHLSVSVLSSTGKNELPSTKANKKRQRVSSTSSDKDDATSSPEDPIFECLYHNLMNKFERPGGEDLGNYHLLTKRLATTIKLLLKNFPQYTPVEDFPLPDADHKMDAAFTLYRMGLLVIAPGNEDLSYMFDSEEEGSDKMASDESGSDVPLLTPIS